MMALIPAWAWRWIAILAVGAALAFTGYVKGREVVQVKFDEYQAQVKAAGDRQNELTQQIIAIHKQRAENAQSQAANLATARDGALARVRALESARASSRIVPPAPAGATGNNRVCFSREELDRGLRAAFARLSERSLANASEGQRAADVAQVCHDWATGK